MPTLRAILTWAVLPLLGFLLVPDLIRFVQAVQEDWLPQWARTLSWASQAGFIAFLLVIALSVLLGRLQFRSDLLAARPFVRLWADRKPGQPFTGTVRLNRVVWRVTVPGQQDPDAPPEIRLTGPGPGRTRALRLAHLGWRVHRDEARRHADA